ncbi:GNAT family N-acetyltransferase [Streptomyces corynorhini]|uniref:GNAT family N-acetyltransferase n=1 Tax=Streptomyces corynorhini TaxID=2282652 RepID=A0A370BC69_9ACTN|nr:GNAT family N-acetyltransferase [Streptomyces corynorhini]RDG39241.1 GNAT family N-acetyltransferase [Streptomyces corynorhini]
MEFTAGGRLEVRVTPADVGKRVSVRQLTGAGPGAEKFTDTVGVLTSWDGDVLLITRRTGESVAVPAASLVAGKVVPAAPARRRGPAATFAELARAAARAWQPVESEPLGAWTLRAAAGPAPGGGPGRVGFTRRANSVLPLGDPGMELDAALTRVRRWYGERGLPAYAQVATGAPDTQEPLRAELERRGWRPEVSAEVLTGALAALGDRDADVARVRLERTVGESWLRRYQRTGTPGPHVRQVLAAGPSVWFATVPGEGGLPAAIGRCVTDGRWAGFMAVEVGPEHRRGGLATTVMTALARRALEEGASAAWLQVETDNEAARALYAGLGFTAHHRYHHFRSP